MELAQEVHASELLDSASFDIVLVDHPMGCPLTADFVDNVVVQKWKCVEQYINSLGGSEDCRQWPAMALVILNDDTPNWPPQLGVLEDPVQANDLLSESTCKLSCSHGDKDDHDGSHIIDFVLN